MYCKTCKWFENGAPYGRCHWQPTTIQRHETDWCGQYVDGASAAQNMAAAIDRGPEKIVPQNTPLLNEVKRAQKGK